VPDFVLRLLAAITHSLPDSGLEIVAADRLGHFGDACSEIAVANHVAVSAH